MPTFITLKNGEILKSFTGVNIKSLDELLENLLKDF